MKTRWKNLSNEVKGVAAGMVSALCLTAYFIINRHVYMAYRPSALEYSLLFAICGAVFGLGSLLHRMDSAMFKKAKKDTKTFVALTLLSFLAMSLLVIGQGYTSAIHAALIGTMTILSTMVFSHLMLSERPSARQTWLLLGLFSGLYIAIVGLHSVHLNKGDLIILSSVIFFGLGNVLARKIMKRQGSFVVPNIRLVLAGGLALLLSLFVMHDIPLMVQILPWTLLAGMFYWLTMKTFAISVHLVNANHAVVLNNSQVIFTSIAGVLLLGEQYSWEKFIGSVMVLVSVYFITWKGRN